MVCRVDKEFVLCGHKPYKKDSEYSSVDSSLREQLLDFTCTELQVKNDKQQFQDSLKWSVITSTQYLNCKLNSCSYTRAVIDPYHFRKCLSVVMDVYCKSDVYKIENIEYDPLFILCRYDGQYIKKCITMCSGGRYWLYVCNNGSLRRMYLYETKKLPNGVRALHYGNYFIHVYDTNENKRSIYAVTYYINDSHNDYYRPFICPDIKLLPESVYNRIKEASQDKSSKFDIHPDITDVIL